MNNNILQRFIINTWQRMKKLDTSSPGEVERTVEVGNRASEFDAFLTNMFGGLLPGNEPQSKPFIQQLNALDLEEHQSSAFDVWKYWLDRRTTHPELSKLALVLLSVPSNQVDVERSFSGMALTLTDRRFNLSEENLESILLIKPNGSLINEIVPEDD